MAVHKLRTHEDQYLGQNHSRLLNCTRIFLQINTDLIQSLCCSRHNEHNSAIFAIFRHHQLSSTIKTQQIPSIITTTSNTSVNNDHIHTQLYPYTNSHKAINTKNKSNNNILERLILRISVKLF